LRVSGVEFQGSGFGVAGWGLDLTRLGILTEARGQVDRLSVDAVEGAHLIRGEGVGCGVWGVGCRVWGVGFSIALVSGR
jgi:hypothetical protein